MGISLVTTYDWWWYGVSRPCRRRMRRSLTRSSCRAVRFRLTSWWSWRVFRSLKLVLHSSSFFNLFAANSIILFWSSPWSPVYKLHPVSRGKRVLVACGPGNNGNWCHVAACQRENKKSNPKSIECMVEGMCLIFFWFHRRRRISRSSPSLALRLPTDDILSKAKQEWAIRKIGHATAELEHLVCRWFWRCAQRDGSCRWCHLRYVA